MNTRFFATLNAVNSQDPLDLILQNCLDSIFEIKISQNNPFSEILLGKKYLMENVNLGHFFEFDCEDMRILKFEIKQDVESKQGNNFDLVPEKSLKLFQKAANAGSKLGREMFEFFRTFGPIEFGFDEEYVFDPRFLQHVVCIDYEAIYVTNGQKFLDEKYYNTARLLKNLNHIFFSQMMEQLHGEIITFFMELAFMLE